MNPHFHPVAHRILHCRIAAALAVSILAGTLAPSGADAQEAIPNHEKFGYYLASRIVNTPLPFTNEDSALSIDLQPKVEDILNEPYIRLPVEITYSSTAKREVNFGITPFFSNPTASDPEFSVGFLNFGLKQRINDDAGDKISFAAGFDARIPLEEIPTEEIRDSFDSYVPYLTTAYRFEDSNRWMAFLTAQYRIVGEDRRDGISATPEPPSLAVLRPGVLYQRSNAIRYSMQLEYRTDRVDGGDDDGLILIPGVTWYPSPTTPFFRRIAGHFELSLEMEYALARLAEDADDDRIGLSLQVRWRFQPRGPRIEDGMP